MYEMEKSKDIKFKCREETTGHIQEAYSQALSDTTSGIQNTMDPQQSRKQHKEQGKLEVDQKRSIFNKDLRQSAARARSVQFSKGKILRGWMSQAVHSPR